jgi:hypothetical protein
MAGQQFVVAILEVVRDLGDDLALSLRPQLAAREAVGDELFQSRIGEPREAIEGSKESAPFLPERLQPSLAVGGQPVASSLTAARRFFPGGQHPPARLHRVEDGTSRLVKSRRQPCAERFMLRGVNQESLDASMGVQDFNSLPAFRRHRRYER